MDSKVDGWGCGSDGWGAQSMNKPPIVPSKKHFGDGIEDKKMQLSKMDSKSADGWGCGSDGWGAQSMNKPPIVPSMKKSPVVPFMKKSPVVPSMKKSPVVPSKMLFVDGIEDKKKRLKLLSIEEITNVFCSNVANISILDVYRYVLPKRINHSAVVELGTVEEAQIAIAKLDGITLDSKHKLTVSFSINTHSRVPTNGHLIQLRKTKRSPEAPAIEKEGEDKQQQIPPKPSINEEEEEVEVYSSCSSGDLPMAQDFEDEIVCESADESSDNAKENCGGEAICKEGEDKQQQMPLKPSINEEDDEEEDVEVYSSCSSGDLPMAQDFEDEIVSESADESADIGEDEMPVF